MAKLEVPHTVKCFLKNVKSLELDEIYKYILSAGPMGIFSQFFCLVNKRGLTRHGLEAEKNIVEWEKRYCMFVGALSLRREYDVVEDFQIAQMITCVFIDPEIRPMPVYNFLMEILESNDRDTVFHNHCSVWSYCLMKNMLGDDGTIAKHVQDQLDTGVGDWDWEDEYRMWFISNFIPGGLLKG